MSEVSEPKFIVETQEATTPEREPMPTETTPANQDTQSDEYTESTEETVITVPEEETVECIDEGDQSLAEYKPQISDQPNFFENDTLTEIDDRPVEDYVGEGEDRPGEGKYF